MERPDRLLTTTPRRHWRTYTDDPLPTPPEALGKPFAAVSRLLGSKAASGARR